jgi:hypothetical protein
MIIYGCLLCLLLDHEVDGSMHLRNFCNNLPVSTRRDIPEDSALHNHCHQDTKANIF